MVAILIENGAADETPRLIGPFDGEAAAGEWLKKQGLVECDGFWMKSIDNDESYEIIELEKVE